jgi:hypothetical protein
MDHWSTNWCRRWTRSASTYGESVTPLPTAPTTLPRSLGYAGLIPFVGLALLLHTSGSHQDFLRHALLAYGACIVSFVGAVHWGIGISTLNKSHLGLGWSVVPSIAAWVALSIDKSGSLVAMAAILVGCLAADLKFYKAGELPRWYFRMRIALTTIGALSLIAGML